MRPEFSIILNAYDTDKAQRHMTIACIGEIVRFTDQPYELIVVDNEPQWAIRDDYKVFPEYQTVVLDPKLTVYGSYNVGADKAHSDKLMFIQSDVFVHERTLNKLSRYLDDWDMCFPQQIELSREDSLKVQNTPDGVLADIGFRDAGLLAITREAFDKSGGWDARFKNLLGEKAFFQRCDDAGVAWTDRTNAMITHIKAGNNLKKPEDLYADEMSYDAKLGREEYGWT